MIAEMDATIERNNRLAAMAITTLVAAVLLLVIFLIEFITPIPPFDQSTRGGLEMNFGFDEAGMGDNNSMDPAAGQKETPKENSFHPEAKLSEMISTDEASNVVVPSVKTKEPEIKVEDPAPDQNLLDALNRVHTSPGTNTGDGNSNIPGNQGDPNGTLNSNVYSRGGGTGTNPEFKLRGSGRKMIRDIAIYDNSQETGIVAVEILVDKFGRIIKAEPVLMGSTTTSSVLWKKAKDGLINQKIFNESGSGEEARGTIYINFTVR